MYKKTQRMKDKCNERKEQSKNAPNPMIFFMNLDFRTVVPIDEPLHSFDALFVEKKKKKKKKKKSKAKKFFGGIVISPPLIWIVELQRHRLRWDLEVDSWWNKAFCASRPGSGSRSWTRSCRVWCQTCDGSCQPRRNLDRRWDSG